jgi:hypothetical protein
MGTGNTGTEATSNGPASVAVASVGSGDLITADTYRSMLTVMENMLSHSHTIKDSYWSNCECQCGGGGTT